MIEARHPIPATHIAEMELLAEREAADIMRRILALLSRADKERRPRPTTDQLYKAANERKARTLAAFLTRIGVTGIPAVTRYAAFYANAFDREFHRVFERGAAALGF